LESRRSRKAKKKTPVNRRAKKERTSFGKRETPIYPESRIATKERDRVGPEVQRRDEKKKKEKKKRKSDTILLGWQLRRREGK